MPPDLAGPDAHERAAQQAPAGRVHLAEAVAAGHGQHAERDAQGQDADGEREAQREDVEAPVAAPATLQPAPAGTRDARATLGDGSHPLADKMGCGALLAAVAAAHLTPDMLLHVCLPPCPRGAPPLCSPPLPASPRPPCGYSAARLSGCWPSERLGACR